MTCRQFSESAGERTLGELVRSQDDEMLEHARQCGRCRTWMEQQHTLVAGIQSLQARTSGRGAGPGVERALIQAFRRMNSGEVLPEIPAPAFAPVVLRSSRHFETGAYLAVAAAIVVGLFLGIHLWQRRDAGDAARTNSASKVAAPAGQNARAVKTPPAPLQSEAAASTTITRPTHVARRGLSTVAAEGSESSSDAEYIPLMFCDPLACSSDSEVVRMELPVAGTNERDTQPQIADVVVGYDGLVRAVRFVN